MEINLSLNTQKEAIKVYLEMLRNFHKLTEKETDVLVELILAYKEYKVKYGSEEAASKLYLESSSRDTIVESLGMNRQVFRNYLTSLKTKKVMDGDKRINKVLIPESIDNNIALTINFKYAAD